MLDGKVRFDIKFAATLDRIECFFAFFSSDVKVLGVEVVDEKMEM